MKYSSLKKYSVTPLELYRFFKEIDRLGLTNSVRSSLTSERHMVKLAKRIDRWTRRVSPANREYYFFRTMEGNGMYHLSYMTKQEFGILQLAKEQSP